MFLSYINGKYAFDYLVVRFEGSARCDVMPFTMTTYMSQGILKIINPRLLF